MKRYYIVGIAISILIFIVVFVVSSISYCGIKQNKADLIEYEKNNTVAIRYVFGYETDENNVGDSVVKYKRVSKNTTGWVLAVPTVEDDPSIAGKEFLGYADAIDGGTMYADSEGNGFVPLSQDITLYAIFRVA